MIQDQNPASTSPDALLAFAIELAQATRPIVLPMFRTPMAVDNKLAGGFDPGTPTWMTLVGVRHAGRMVAGVAGQPFTDEIFAGTAAGSHLLRANRTIGLRCTSETDLTKVLAGTTAPSLFRKYGHEARLMRIEDAVQSVRYDADAYFHCMVAAGQLGISLDTGLQSYDIAALIPIVEGAGGIVTTWDGGDPTDGGDILVAANKPLHDQAMALLA